MKRALKRALKDIQGSGSVLVWQQWACAKMATNDDEDDDDAADEDGDDADDGLGWSLRERMMCCDGAPTK